MGAGTGAAGGAGGGAAAGAGFGPWGAAIGAGVGAVAGGIGGYMQDKREREALEEQRRIQALSDEERRRLMVADMLERSRQSQAYYAGQNVPTGA